MAAGEKLYFRYQVILMLGYLLSLYHREMRDKPNTTQGVGMSANWGALTAVCR